MNAPNPNVSPSPVRVEVTAIDATTAPIPTTNAAQPIHHLAELFTKTSKHPFQPPEVATPAGFGEFVRQMKDTSNHLDVLLAELVDPASEASFAGATAVCETPEAPMG